MKILLQFKGIQKEKVLAKYAPAQKTQKKPRGK